MIPLRQTIPVARFPWVTRSIVALDVIAFLVQMTSGRWGEVLVNIFGFIPYRFFAPRFYSYSWFEVGLTLITSLFLHGGVVHIVGNMLYLWIFGPGVEEKM